MHDCKTCKHATILFSRAKDDRYSAAYAPIDYVRCAGPRYKGRAYFCKASRKACAEHEARALKDTAAPAEPPAIAPFT